MSGRTARPVIDTSAAVIIRMAHARARVLPLQAMGRGRRSARLLDDDGSRADGRPFRGSARRVGAAARDGGLARRSTNLRLAPLDHVLAQVVLLLRPSEEELPRAVR